MAPDTRYYRLQLYRYRYRYRYWKWRPPQLEANIRYKCYTYLTYFSKHNAVNIMFRNCMRQTIGLKLQACMQQCWLLIQVNELLSIGRYRYPPILASIGRYGYRSNPINVLVHLGIYGQKHFFSWSARISQSFREVVLSTGSWSPVSGTGRWVSRRAAPRAPVRRPGARGRYPGRGRARGRRTAAQRTWYS